MGHRNIITPAEAKILVLRPEDQKVWLQGQTKQKTVLCLMFFIALLAFYRAKVDLG